MALRQMKLGDFGMILQPRFINKFTGAVLNISTYTTLQMVITDPEGDETVRTAVFAPPLSDGSDGKLRYVIVAADTEDSGRTGTYRFEGRIAKTGERITAPPIFVKVG